MTITVRKATWLSSLGAGLEYYDFIVYGMMVSYLNTLFFISSESWIAVMKAFGVFALGYLARPFGGIIFGIIGDTYGRKNSFIFVMLLMAISTLAIGCLPTYADIGVLAPVLLVGFRLLQGLSFGAELPCAITIVSEYAEPKKTSLFSGFVISSVSIGSMLASLILYILSKGIAKDQILHWGWRIPFLLGGLLALANYFIRKHLQETPAFSQLQSDKPSSRLKKPLQRLFNEHFRETIAGLGMTVFIASLVIFNLYLPAYLSTHFGYSYLLSDVYLAMTWGLVWSALSLPICGYLADRWGRREIFLATSVIFILISFPLFHLLTIGGFAPLIGFLTIYQTVISFLMTSYFPLLSAAFSTRERYTGIAFCYNVAYAIMGAAPIGITYLIQILKTPMVSVWFLIVCAFISIASLFLLKRKEAA